MKDQLIGKIAMITGAGSGIGKTTALMMAGRGAKIVVSDINEASAKETAKLIKEASGEAEAVVCDVSNFEEVKSLMEQTISKYGRLDIAVNNAGIAGPYQHTMAYEHQDWERVIAINQTGVFYCMQEELKIMVEQQSGSIINVSSVAGMKALANCSAYVASKHAVLGLTKTAALEYARFKIRVNAICPVFTLTPIMDGLFDLDPKMEEKLKKLIPMRRYGKPEETAEAICWLASDASSFSTGLCLPIDGGLTA